VTPYPQALETILAKVGPLPVERVPLELAHGRALAADAISNVALPARDNSGMDGYAVRAADLERASPDSPVALRVASRVTAGDAAEVAVEPGQAARIMTGGALPPGADAVVMQEDVERNGDEAAFRAAAKPGQYVRRAGDDLRAGAVAVRAGVPLGASELALLASLGHTHLAVPRRPRVALISTGDEIVELGRGRETAPTNKLVDSNAVALGIRLRKLGAEVVQLGVAPDDPAAIRARFEAARGCELVISSAGVSVGEKDYVKSVLTSLGAVMHLERVAIRPGKPLVFATTPEQFFFGLPGNPVSSRVTFELFVRPAVEALMGIRERPRAIPAALARDFEKPEPLTFFARVRLAREGERLVATPMQTQNSNYLSSLVGADGIAVLPAGRGLIRAGEVVEVLPLE